MKSNCLIFAATRFFSRGGYLIVRKSSYGWWPHFSWSEDLVTFEKFVPLGPCEKRIIPPLLFRGQPFSYRPTVPGRLYRLKPGEGDPTITQISRKVSEFAYAERDS